MEEFSFHANTLYRWGQKNVAIFCKANLQGCTFVCYILLCVLLISLLNVCINCRMMTLWWWAHCQFGRISISQQLCVFLQIWLGSRGKTESKRLLQNWDWRLVLTQRYHWKIVSSLLVFAIIIIHCLAIIVVVWRIVSSLLFFAIIIIHCLAIIVVAWSYVLCVCVLCICV